MKMIHAMFQMWQLELWKAFKSVGGMRVVSFNMGALGHKGKRPTTVGTNYPLLFGLDGNWDWDDTCVPSSLVSKEEKRLWPTRFKFWSLKPSRMAWMVSKLNKKDLLRLV